MKNIKLIVDNQVQNAPEGEEPLGWPLVGLSVGSFLQVIAMDQQTCLLEVYRNGNQKGHFCLIQGSLFDASCGEFEGEEAALEMIAWENVRLNIRHVLDTSVIEKRIDKNLMLLLMESSRRKDEREESHHAHEDEEHASHDKPLDFDAVFGEKEEHPSASPIHYDQLSTCIEPLIKDMGDALERSCIIDLRNGNIVAGYNTIPATADIFTNIAGFVRDAFSKSSVVALGRFWLLNLEDDKTICFLLFEDYIWGIEFNREKMLLGLFLSVVVPKSIKRFEDKITTKGP